MVPTTGLSAASRMLRQGQAKKLQVLLHAEEGAKDGDNVREVQGPLHISCLKKGFIILLKGMSCYFRLNKEAR
jgi:hypothetical protein